MSNMSIFNTTNNELILDFDDNESSISVIDTSYESDLADDKDDTESVRYSKIMRRSMNVIKELKCLQNSKSPHFLNEMVREMVLEDCDNDKQYNYDILDFHICNIVCSVVINICYGYFDLVSNGCDENNKWNVDISLCVPFVGIVKSSMSEIKLLLTFTKKNTFLLCEVSDEVLDKIRNIKSEYIYNKITDKIEHKWSNSRASALFEEKQLLINKSMYECSVCMDKTSTSTECCNQGLCYLCALEISKNKEAYPCPCCRKMYSD